MTATKALAIYIAILLTPMAVYSQHAEEGASIGVTESLDMFDLMTRSSHVDYEPITLDQALDQSSLVLVGSIADVHPGQRLRHFREDPGMPPLETVIFEVDVKIILKGSENADTVYFEYAKGAVPPERYANAIYTGDVLLFLRPPGWEYSQYSITNVDEDFMRVAREHLYELTTRSGFFIEEDSTLVSPLDRGSLLERDPVLDGQDIEAMERIIQGQNE